MTTSSLALLPDGYPVFATKHDLNCRNLVPEINAFSFHCSGSGTTTNDWKIPDHMYLGAITGYFNGQSNGDYISVSVVDVDNILGFGAGVVLSNPVIKCFVNPTSNQLMQIDIGYPVFMLQNIYIRISYTSSNILSSVEAYVNVIANKVFP